MMDSHDLSDKVHARLEGKTPMVWSEHTFRYELDLHPIIVAVLAVLVDEGFLAYATELPHVAAIGEGTE